MKRRFIQNLPSGMTLVEYSDPRLTITGGDMADEVELNVTDEEWANIHRQLAAGKLDFDQVKQSHAKPKKN